LTGGPLHRDFPSPSPAVSRVVKVRHGPCNGAGCGPHAAIQRPEGSSASATARLFAGAKEVAILDGYDQALHLNRFNLAIDVIDRVPKLQATAAHTKEWLEDQIVDCVNYAHENGIDRQETREWKWPGDASQT